MAYVRTVMQKRIWICLIALGMSRECCSFPAGIHQRATTAEGDQIT